MKTRTRILSVIGALIVQNPGIALAQDSAKNSFKNFEIRVIRSKYFQKSGRFEIGANIGAVMNSSFTYTFVPSAKLGLHVAEWLELFGEGSAGITVNKSSCTDLGSKFNIEPVVDEIGLLAGGGAAVTPIYGKYQLSSGDVIYFDWYLVGGGGIAAMTNRKQGCKPLGPNEQAVPPKPYSPSQFFAGTGQRYFMNKNSSVNWGLRFYFIPGVNGGMNTSITLAAGAGYYF
jgi:hypothetical protein